MISSVKPQKRSGRPGFSRVWMPCTLLFCAALIAWVGQALIAQSPQQQQGPRRIFPLPRRPFRNPQPNKSDPKANAPKENEKPEDPPAEENPGESDPKMVDEGKGAPKTGFNGPGNVLSIVDRPETSKKNPGANNPSDIEREREELFVGWQQPKVVLFLTGNQLGYIEPCGCAGLENQKGGLTRRITLLNDLTANKGWEVVPLDVGQLSNEERADRQQELKLQLIAKGLSEIMKYQAVGLGPSDLALSTAELGGIVSNLPAVSANVSVFERAIGLVPTHRVINAGGMKIGVTQIVSDNALRKVLASDVEKGPVAAAMAAVVEKLKAEKCDFNILLAYAQVEEAEAIAKKYPTFDLVVHGELHGDPEKEIRKFTSKQGAKNTYFVGVGYKGMHAAVVGLFNDAKAPVKYQRIPLDSRFSDSKEGLQLLADYQRELKSAGLKGLGIQPKPFPGGREFVGSNECGNCHTKAFAKWQTTAHAHATDSIVNPKERAGIARHHDPECLSCHVTGWNPQKYYPYTTGYVDLEKSAHLHANGCENCHGPGSKHVAAENGGVTSEAELEKLRASMRLPLANAKKKCQECHDIDNSPEFDKEGAFERYWEEVKHSGRD